MLKDEILRVFPKKIRQILEDIAPDFERVQEIRIRADQGIILLENGREYIEEVDVGLRELREIVEIACGYSGYAFEEEIKCGYITIEGGHRIGLAGKAVMTEQGVQTLKYITSLNIRIAHSVVGCAKRWKNYFYKDGLPCHILLVSPPGGGKTTLLRDMIKLFSDGTSNHQGVTVGVVDERSEIAGTYRGNPNHNLGKRTDVLDGCPKSFGVEMLLRSMAPKVLAMDEIGVGDVNAIENALRCGCKVLATLHGECMEDYIEKPGFGSLVREKVFERYVFLDAGQMPGRIKMICGKNYEILWEENGCI